MADMKPCLNQVRDMEKAQRLYSHLLQRSCHLLCGVLWWWRLVRYHYLPLLVLMWWHLAGESHKIHLQCKVVWLLKIRCCLKWPVLANYLITVNSPINAPLPINPIVFPETLQAIFRFLLITKPKLVRFSFRIKSPAADCAFYNPQACFSTWCVY